ncbi:MAG: putative rane protein [Deltaproteobacteria bacterium]|jgi:uncharacterized membrane protein|nr:putative rane protein [Deltaproteobacteria bacterium]MBP1776956.1 putative rane protein [candidate division NC10 bacterium]
MREVIEHVTIGIEALAVAVIVGGIVYSVARYFLRTRLQGSGRYKRFKDRIGNSLLLGLEFLVAADIIRTVALDPTIQSVAMLGLLVLIRTFLSWALVVEIEGAWPWQAKTTAVTGE